MTQSTISQSLELRAAEPTGGSKDEEVEVVMEEEEVMVLTSMFGVVEMVFSFVQMHVLGRPLDSVQMVPLCCSLVAHTSVVVPMLLVALFLIAGVSFVQLVVAAAAGVSVFDSPDSSVVALLVVFVTHVMLALVVLFTSRWPRLREYVPEPALWLSYVVLVVVGLWKHEAEDADREGVEIALEQLCFLLVATWMVFHCTVSGPRRRWRDVALHVPSLLTAGVMVLVLVGACSDSVRLASADHGQGTLVVLMILVFVLLSKTAPHQASKERHRPSKWAESSAKSDFSTDPMEHIRFFASISHELRTPLHGILAIADDLLIELEDSVRLPFGSPPTSQQEPVPEPSSLSSAHATSALLMDLATVGVDRPQTLEDDDAPDAPPPGPYMFWADSLRSVRNSANTILGVVHNVLDLSRMASETLTLAHEPFVLADAVQQVVDAVYMKSGGRDVALSLDFDGAADPRHDFGVVLGDSSRVQQVLLNLLANAVTFTDQGRVSVTVSHRMPPILRSTVDEVATERQLSNMSGASKPLEDAHLDRLVQQEPLGTRNRDPSQSVRDSLENDSFVYFQIADTGVGMSEEHARSCFNRFLSSGSRLKGIERVGLGLSVCSSLVELMGGYIGVHSVLQEGTTFVYALPLERAPNQDQALRSLDEEADTIGDPEDSLPVWGSVLRVVSNTNGDAASKDVEEDVEEVHVRPDRPFARNEHLRAQPMLIGKSPAVVSRKLFSASPPTSTSRSRFVAVYSSPDMTPGGPVHRRLSSQSAPSRQDTIENRKADSGADEAENAASAPSATVSISRSRSLRRGSMPAEPYQPHTTSLAVASVAQVMLDKIDRRFRRSPDASPMRESPRMLWTSVPKKAAPSSANTSPKLQNVPHVLMVDDNIINRKVLGRGLSRAQLLFDTAVDGQEAVDKWIQGQHAVVLLDINMPVMNGIEAARLIRERTSRWPSEQQPYVLAVTAQQLSKEEAVALRFDDVVQKPFKPADIAKIVKRELSKRHCLFLASAPALGEATRRAARSSAAASGTSIAHDVAEVLQKQGRSVSDLSAVSSSSAGMEHSLRASERQSRRRQLGSRRRSKRNLGDLDDLDGRLVGLSTTPEAGVRSGVYKSPPLQKSRSDSRLKVPGKGKGDGVVDGSAEAAVRRLQASDGEVREGRGRGVGEESGDSDSV